MKQNKTQAKPLEHIYSMRFSSFILVIILSETATMHFLPLKQEPQLTGCLFADFFSARMEKREMALQRMAG